MRNFTQEYKYDQIGNLLQMKSNGVWTRDYMYNFATNNYLLKHNENPTINSYEYDQHGNTTKMPHLPEMKYDYADQLNEVTLNASGNKAYYIYNAEGERVRKIIEKGNIIEERFYLGDYEIYSKKTNGTLDVERETLHINDDTKKIALIETKTGESAVIRYQYDNHIGSASIELNDNAEIISYEEYHPFGTTSYRSGRSETETSLKRYKYVGKERDEETGLYYYGARFYDAQLGRFHTVDPLAEEFYDNSPYNYVFNNPLNFTDPDGRSGVATIKKDKDGNEYVEVSSTLYFYGDLSSSKFATSIAAHIQSMANAANGAVTIDGKEYSVKFNITGKHVSEDEATELATNNGDNAENNFIRVTDASNWSSSAGTKSSSYNTPGNSGIFLTYEMGGAKSTDTHEYFHGLGWYEAGDVDGGRHDVYPLDSNGKNPKPGIMSPRGTPVYDQHGYNGQTFGQKTLDASKRRVLASDILKVQVNMKSAMDVMRTRKVNIGGTSNKIYNKNGTLKN